MNFPLILRRNGLRKTVKKCKHLTIKTRKKCKPKIDHPKGIAVGFDAMQRATIVGTKMAGLLGEIFTFETPELKIPFSFPCVQLQTVKGQPREDYLPTIPVKQQSEIIKTAIKILKEFKKTNRKLISK